MPPTDAAKMAVSARSIIEHLDVVEDIGSGQVSCSPGVSTIPGEVHLTYHVVQISWGSSDECGPDIALLRGKVGCCPIALLETSGSCRGPSDAAVHVLDLEATGFMQMRLYRTLIY